MAKFLHKDEVVTLANALAKCACWAELDVEALTTALKEKYPKNDSITATELKAVFMELTLDKEVVPEGAEGEDAAAEEEGEELDENGEPKPKADKPPPPPPEVSKNAEKYFELLCQALDVNTANDGGDLQLPLSRMLSLLFLCKNGYGEGVFQFVLKQLDPASLGAITETSLFSAITWTANSLVQGPVRTHLRRAWRSSEKYVPPEPEPLEEGAEDGEVEVEGDAAEEEKEAEAEAEATGEEQPAEGAAAEGKEGEAKEDGAEAAEADGEKTEEAESADAEVSSSSGGGGAAATPVEPVKPPVEEPKIMIESFMEKMREDERLSALLLKDVAVPIEEPKAEGEEGAGDE